MTLALNDIGNRTDHSTGSVDVLTAITWSLANLRTNLQMITFGRFEGLRDGTRWAAGLGLLIVENFVLEDILILLQKK